MESDAREGCGTEKSHNSGLRLAMLIDAENISAKTMDWIFQQVSKLGKLVIRTAYADWGDPGVFPWRETCNRYSIEPVMSMNHTKHKNSTDMKLVMEGMKLHYGNKNFDGFVLVTSDSDFTEFAEEMRRENRVVYGFGSRDASLALANACDKYFRWERSFASDCGKRKLDIQETGDSCKSLHFSSYSGFFF